MVQVKPNLAIIGTGSWGVTLAIHAAGSGATVALLARTAAEAALLDERRESPRLPGVALPPGVIATADAAVLSEIPLVLLVVPAQTMRANVRAVQAVLSPDAVLVSCSKGLELDTALRMSEVIAQEWSPGQSGGTGRIAALSGPNLAREIVAGKPASAVVACPDEAGARLAQARLLSPQFRLYTQRDVIGVELAGALKNVIALGAGMCDGLNVGDNAKAAFMTRGLAEIARLGKAAGAEPITFAGLAGLGDLVATCMSPLSRNRTTGERLARGERLEDVQCDPSLGSGQALRQVAEGVPTTLAALALARRYGVEMPIATLMRRVLFEGLSPRDAATMLMQRDPKAEWEGIV